MKDEIIRMAKDWEWIGGAEGWTFNSYQDLERFYNLAVQHEREKVARWMMERSYVTGHGDTIEDLLTELDWQVREKEREECAKVCDRFQARDVGMQPAECAGAIRHRSKIDSIVQNERSARGEKQ